MRGYSKLACFVSIFGLLINNLTYKVEVIIILLNRYSNLIGDG